MIKAENNGLKIKVAAKMAEEWSRIVIQQIIYNIKYNFMHLQLIAQTLKITWVVPS